MTRDARADLRTATKARQRADERAKEAEQRWRDAVRAAFDAGLPREEVAALAGVSRARAFQVYNGTR